VKSEKSGKEVFFFATDAGRALCMKYREVREHCLIETLKDSGLTNEQIGDAAQLLRNASGLYDTAARAARLVVNDCGSDAERGDARDAGAASRVASSGVRVERAVGDDPAHRQIVRLGRQRVDAARVVRDADRHRQRVARPCRERAVVIAAAVAEPVALQIESTHGISNRSGTTAMPDAGSGIR
jgi:hypothetical protein